MTKSWGTLAYGIMEREGLIYETLGDIWPEESVWEYTENAEARQNIPLEYLLKMRAGITMPEASGQGK